MTLQEEAAEIERLLAGKTVARAFRHTADQVAIEFTDGSRFFADVLGDAIDVSITIDGHSDEEA